MNDRKNIVLISGANKGLGEAFFDLLFANRSIHLVVSVSRKMNEFQKSLVCSRDGRFQFLKLDLGSLTSRLPLKKLDEYTDIAENVTFLNNAGVVDPIGRVGEFSDDEIVNSVNVNVLAPAIITNYLLSIFGQKKLKLINISSGAAKQVIDGWSLYSSGKAFTHMWTSSILNQNDESFSAVGANVDPGVVDTDMQSTIRNATNPGFTNQEYFVDLKKNGRLQNARDVAARILKEHELLP